MNQTPNWSELLGLQSRFQKMDTFCFAEVGVSNFQLFFELAALWQAKARPIASLHYVIFTSQPLAKPSVDNLQPLRKQGLQNSIVEELLSQFPTHLPGWQQASCLAGRIQLSVYYGDLLQGMTDSDMKVDGWVLSHQKKSDKTLFSSRIFVSQIRRQSRSNTQLSSVHQDIDSVRVLEQTGFHVQANQPETGLIAQVNGDRRFSSKAPWFERPSAFENPGNVVVVGAGLAGSSVAYELAEAGWSVTVLEAKTQAADGASGNLAGAVHPLVTADWNLRSQWYWQGFQATLARVKPWLETNKIQGNLNGLVHLAVDKKTQQRMQEALDRFGLPADFAYWVEAEQASELLGGTVLQPGLFFPKAGWLNPPSIVAACLDHPQIEIAYEQSVHKIAENSKSSSKQPNWSLHTKNKIWQADAVVLAEGAFPTLVDSLLIRPLKGQVSNISPKQQAWTLKRAVSHLGYSAPAINNMAVTGATFEAPSLDPNVSMHSHQLNLDSVASSLPDWLDLQPEKLTGRVGFRPTTPDHLPVIGGLTDLSWLESDYLSQSHTQAIFKYPSQRYRAGLYVTNGHGARGLMSVFLAAKLIRADMMGEAVTIAPSLYAATHPARFKIRDWRRNGAV